MLLFLCCFQTAKGGIYAKLNKGMEKDPNNIASTEAAALAKVRSEKYALMGDETFLLMNATDNCKISLARERFYKSGFGLAFPEGWSYMDHFNLA